MEDGGREEDGRILARESAYLFPSSHVSPTYAAGDMSALVDTFIGQECYLC